MTTSKNYPDHMMRILRVRRDLTASDTSEDEAIRAYSRDMALSEILAWKGMGGYKEALKEWVQEIYHVSLEEK